MTLGEEFRLLRKDKGLTMAETADKVVSIQQLTKFEQSECGLGAKKML